MKRLLYHLVILVSLTSCSSTYFYSTLNTSSKKTKKDSEGYFVTKLDSVDIVHSFKGENAPIMISVYNYSTQPVYIDWNKSSVIMDGVSTSYAGNIIPLWGQSTTNTHENSLSPTSSFSTSTFKGALSMPDNIAFIPPHSKINYQTLSLANFGFNQIENKRYENKKMRNKNGTQVNVKVIDFSVSKSPFKFRSYITLYKEPQSPLITDEEFYISKLIKTKGNGPSSFNASIFDRGDTFYIKIANPNNQFGNILLGTTLLVGVVVLDAALTNSSTSN